MILYLPGGIMCFDACVANPSTRWFVTAEHANPHSFEIVDHDMADAVCVLMQPGDALFFHSHLMHKSTDNQSTDRRAAMVCHYRQAGTVDLNLAQHGRTASNIDWMPVRRSSDVSSD